MPAQNPLLWKKTMASLFNALLCFFGFHQWHYHRTLSSDEQRRICQVLNCPAYQRLIEEGDLDYGGVHPFWEDIQ